MSIAERHLPDLYDVEDAADQLAERSENISGARDHAFEQGMDEYSADGARDELAARRFTHPTLIADFCAGWDTAALDEAVARQQEGST